MGFLTHSIYCSSLTPLNQTELGQHFGLSAISMGKKLVELGLRDVDTKQATPKALNQELAKIISFQKGTETVLMTVWHKKSIDYLQSRLQDKATLVARFVGYLKNMEYAHNQYETTGSKVHMWQLDAACDEFKEAFLPHIKDTSLMKECLKKFKQKKLSSFFEYAISEEQIAELRVIIQTYELENTVPTSSTTLENIRIQKI